MNRKAKVFVIGSLAAAVIAGGSAIAVAAVPSNASHSLAGCVNASRTSDHLYTNPGNFPGCPAGEAPFSLGGSTTKVSALANGPYPGATKLTVGNNSTSEWAPDGTLQTSWVQCPSGYVATGGGFGPNGDQSTAPNANDGKVVVTSSAPDYIATGVNVALGQGTPPSVNADGAFPPNGWAVQGYNNGSSPVIVRPWVVCMSIS